MAVAAFDLFRLFTIIVSLGPKIPKAIEYLKALYALFADDIQSALPGGGLSITELSPEVSALAGQISQALTADGSQAVLDPAQHLELAHWLNSIKGTKRGAALIAGIEALAC